MYATRIDSGPETHLPICGCGWRGLPAPTKPAAHAQATAHEQRCHPHQDKARRSARSAARRA